MCVNALVGVTTQFADLCWVWLHIWNSNTGQVNSSALDPIPQSFCRNSFGISKVGYHRSPRSTSHDQAVNTTGICKAISLCHLSHEMIVCIEIHNNMSQDYGTQMRLFACSTSPSLTHVKPLIWWMLMLLVDWYGSITSCFTKNNDLPGPIWSLYYSMTWLRPLIFVGSTSFSLDQREFNQERPQAMGWAPENP